MVEEDIIAFNVKERELFMKNGLDLVIDKCNINEPLKDQLDSSQCYIFDKSAIKKNDQWTAREVHLPSNLM